MPDPQDDLRYTDPPRGFAVLRESELDPDQGRADRWTYRGIVNGRSVIRSGLTSHAAACRASWLVVDDLLARGAAVQTEDITDADAAVATALARRHAIRREREADRAAKVMPTVYTVEVDSWAAMTASLLAQMLQDVGSIRKLAKALDVPRSTLGAWVREHNERGTWPR